MSELRPVDLIPVVPPLNVGKCWDLALPWLTRAAKDGGWPLEALAAGIHQNYYQLWLCWRDNPPAVVGAGVSRVIKQTDALAGDIVAFAADNAEELLPLLDRLEDYFRERGCKHMKIVGRPGWMKKLPAYKRTAVVLEKAL